MGITIFFIISFVYTVLGATGIVQSLTPRLGPALDGKFVYVLAVFCAICALLYAAKRKVKLHDSMLLGMLTNACVQVTGGLGSAIFPLYLLIVPVVAYKDTYRDYWIVASGITGIEVLASIFRHSFVTLPVVLLATGAVIAGVIGKKWLDREFMIRRALIKYETRDQFFGPADFEVKSIITSMKDIDRHPGIERPLLYFIKFIHSSFHAYSTAIFAYHNNNLALIQGFSRSELFQPQAVVDLRSGLYRQIIAEQKSVLIREFTQNPEELGYYKGELKISSAIIAPIMIMDRIEGVLVIDRKDGEFTEEEKMRFDEAALGTGFLLAMLRLYEKERYEATYLKSIATLVKELQRGLELKEILADTVKAFKDVLKCDDMSIASMDELNEEGVVLESTRVKENTRFSFDDGLVGLIGRHKNYILKEDLGDGDFVVLKKGQKSNTGSFVGVPIFAGATNKESDELLGVIWLEDHRRKRFNEDDLKALNMLASQLTLAWQRAILHERVKEQSIRDGLTGLYNHRHFQEALEKELEKHRELVLIMFDIDHFKMVNDIHGHDAGDKVLRMVADNVMRTVRDADLAFRFGGEEFVAVLTSTTMTRATQVAERIRANLEGSVCDLGCGNQLRITASLGVTSMRAGDTPLSIFNRADSAMYQAKTAGRNRVEVAQEEN